MTDVFISYAHDDRVIAERLAGALRKCGCVVWWPFESNPGDASEPATEDAFKAARCVLVLWSRASVDKPRLAEHAARAARRRALISVLIDDLKPPFVFPPAQVLPLTEASGAVTDLGLQRLLAAVARRLDRPAPSPVDAGGQDATINAASLPAHLRAYPAGHSLLAVLDALTFADGGARPAALRKAEVVLIEQMLDDHCPAVAVQQTLTEINNEIYRRCTADVIDGMSADGWGEPPVPLTVIVMGSSGRGENYLSSDQDNGFILGDYPDSEHHRIDGYFRQLAERLCRRLNEAGLPFCNGYCMAVNPLWRKSLGQWIEQVSLWVDRRNFVALRLAAIFFDFKGVWGNLALSHALRHDLTRRARERPEFLRQMLREIAGHKVALGFFGDLRAEKDGHLGIGKIDVKRAGIVPLVEAIRLLALLEGIEGTSTLARIAGLRAKGALAEDEANELASAFCILTDILLRKEVKDYRVGHRVSYELYPEAMTERDKLVLIEPLRAIRRFRRRLRHQLIEERPDIAAT